MKFSSYNYDVMCYFQWPTGPASSLLSLQSAPFSHYFHLANPMDNKERMTGWSWKIPTGQFWVLPESKTLSHAILLDLSELSPQRCWQWGSDRLCDSLQVTLPAGSKDRTLRSADSTSGGWAHLEQLPKYSQAHDFGHILCFLYYPS